MKCVCASSVAAMTSRNTHPIVCASADRDPTNPDLWRWIVTVPSDLGEPIFERCGMANNEAKAKERLAAAKLAFANEWEAMLTEPAPNAEP